MRTFYRIIAVLIINIPMIVYSQDFFKQDSIILEITAMKKIDTWAKREGFYKFHDTWNHIRFTFNPEENMFQSKYYFKKNCFRTSDYDTIVKHKDDSSKIMGNYALPKDLIVELTRQLATDKCADSVYKDSICCNLTHKDFDIDNRWLRENINRKAILKRAKELDRKWEFGCRYSMRDDRLIAFKSYSNTDSLDRFLADFQKPTGLIFMSHLSQVLFIDLILKGDTLISYTKIISPLDSQTSWIDNKTMKMAYNPKINLILYEMLPNRFLYKDIIEREFIKETYVNWILDRWD